MNHVEAPPIRVVLVDDHEVVRLGLRTLLARTPDLELVAEAGTVGEAIAAAERIQPDVVLMDVRLPDGSGIDACRELQAVCPNTRVLFLTSYADDDTILQAVHAGAHGYLLKEVGGESLLHAVRSVAAGQSIFHPVVTCAMLTRLRAPATEHGPAAALSDKEQHVLELVAKGKTNKQIGTALALSPRTVKNYLSRIFQKLGVTRRSQAAAFFSRRHTH